ncbi:MAG: hypothetical protein COA69_09950 [Robiginitomaculum sp.]|nr:MAG: hypothetical protein COA69_09950 [Robiginitomaculum sp.]
MTQLIETYRGEALAWEADELGHMNMRYYFAKTAEARAIFCTKLHLKDAYKADGFSTLIPTRQHIKYHKEVRPGHGMVVRSGILELGENTMVLVHMITSPSGSSASGWTAQSAGEGAGEGEILSATIVETLEHVSRRTQTVFPWPQRVRMAAKPYLVDMPAAAAPRNIDLDEPIVDPTIAQADALDLPIIGQGMFEPSECDAFGIVSATSMIGRISNSAQHLKTAWPDLDFTGDSGLSGALLEACARHRRWPRAGDCFVIRSGLRSVTTHTRELCHWILDPVTGKCWSSFVGVGCRFNLKTRKLVKVDQATLDILWPGIVDGLKP